MQNITILFTIYISIMNNIITYIITKLRQINKCIQSESYAEITYVGASSIGNKPFPQ